MLRGALPGTFVGPQAVGPREAEELRRLMDLATAAAKAEPEASAAAAAAVAGEGLGTTYVKSYQAPSLEGLT